MLMILVRRLMIMASLSALACSPPPKPPTPQEKLERLYRSGKMFQGAIEVGLTPMQHQAMLQSFAGELMIGVDTAATEPEKAVVAAYRTAFIVLMDANTLWQASVRTAGETWMPKDSIFAEESAVAEVIARHKITPTKHKTSYGSAFDIIPSSTIQDLLTAGNAALSKADVVYLKAEAPK